MVTPTFSIPKAQQKVFIENFMRQVLDVALGLVEEGRDKDSPGETIYAVAQAVIREIHRMHAGADEE